MKMARAAEVQIDDLSVAQVNVDGSETQSLAPKWKLYFLLLGLCFNLLLSTLETTIVSTALVSITNDLDGFSQRDWIVTSYLLTYTGFLTIFAKLSDIFGRKVLLLFSLVIFVVFSILCGASRSMTNLTIFRAFQGIGGSGIYSLVSVTTVQVVPHEKLGKYGAAVSSVFALASVLGPLLGGAITAKPKNWPWVFYLNGPLGVCAIALIIAFLPSTDADRETSKIFRKNAPSNAWRRLDHIGAIILLAASVLLIFVLEEAGTRLLWKSTTIIICIVLCAVLWILFPVWEHFAVGQRHTLREPIFPMGLLKSRFVSGMLLYAFFSGFPFLGVVINLPQRFQAVNDVSPFLAGIYLLPLLLCTPVAAAACGFCTSRLKLAPFYLVVAGAALQILGLGLMTSLPSTPLELQKQQFGFEVIMGLGFGLGLTTLLVMVPIVVEEKDKAVMTGAVTQVRVLGGTIGLAILSQVLNRDVERQLNTIVPPAVVQEIYQSVSTINRLNPAQQYAVRVVFADGYTLLMKVLAGFSGLVLFIAFMLWEKQPRKL
ncbi:Hypothetical protein R9X50_00677400 [Acrodontium crateriforme]|uniref:Major facilitator superfamily (MFS) profile domain-containing protein n=1 Tax=Acrodontium crateriforme TaxID=150365 RepID=A0AAQ3R719_9PEZI|nr:Hypothetical protein R9X50_00677400 [Acrodontium crateriforme]